MNYFHWCTPIRTENCHVLWQWHCRRGPLPAGDAQPALGEAAVPGGIIGLPPCPSSYGDLHRSAIWVTSGVTFTHYSVHFSLWMWLAVQGYDLGLLQLPFPWAIGDTVYCMIFPPCWEWSGKLTVNTDLWERPGNPVDPDIGPLVDRSTNKDLAIQQCLTWMWFLSC